MTALENLLNDQRRCDGPAREVAVRAGQIGEMFAVVLFAPGAAAQEVTTAHAKLHPVNQSTVYASIYFTATAGTVQVTGTATGSQPSAGRYLSLVCDLGSHRSTP